METRRMATGSGAALRTREGFLKVHDGVEGGWALGLLPRAQN